jgi:hypothetical protein
VSKGKKDPHIQYGPPSETWLWDLYPLADAAWGNVLGFNDNSGDGSTIEMRMWLPVNRLSNFPPPAYRPAHAALPPLYSDGGKRRCYIPTDEDRALVARLFPGTHNPANPSWPKVEAGLVVAGHRKDDLATMSAPALLALLAKTQGKAAAPADEESTVDRAAAFIKKNPGKKASEIARHCGVEKAYLINHIARKLREMGFTSKRGCEGGYYPPEKPAR